MSTWPLSLAALDAICLATFGEQITYQRPQGPKYDAVAAFQCAAIISTGGEYASPDGKIWGQVFVLTSVITLGPQKGDQVTITTPTAALATGTYLVQEIFPDDKAGATRLMVRWTGQ